MLCEEMIAIPGQCNACGMVDLVVEIKDDIQVCLACEQGLVQTFEDDFNLSRIEGELANVTKRC